MINQNQFCALASSEKFRDWLKKIDRPLFDDLLEHLKKGFGCKANREKMKQIFDRLRVDTEKYDLLVDWLKKTYPSTLDGSDPTKLLRISGKTDDIHGIFPDYSPTLRTMPRRLIISLHDAVKNKMDLTSLVAAFCLRQAYCDYVVTGDRAYVEYVPQDLAYLVEKIPDKSWSIPAFRMKQLANQ